MSGSLSPFAVVSLDTYPPTRLSAYPLQLLFDMTWTTGALTERLPNGLTLVAQRDPAAPAAAVITHVRAGFFDEPDEWQGISHVLEHMFFKGTARRGVGKIAQETKALGGYLNASTSYDRTMYYAVLPVRNLGAAIDIQADALRHPTIDADELARELKVIIEEAKRKLDSPNAVAGETLHELLYDQHRIRRWRIGYEAQLAGFTAKDVRGYYASRYTPDRVVVALVGDRPAEELLAIARPYYADWSAAPTAIPDGPTERSAPAPRVRTLRGDVTQADLVLGWRSVPALHPDDAALDLAAAILGTGRGSWLHRALREPGIAASSGAYSYAPDEVGVFGVAASGDAGRIGEMVRGLAAEVRRLRETGPTIEDVERARTLLRVRWVRQMESFEARATGLAWAAAHGDVTLLDSEYEKLLRVTPAEVRAVAERYLDPGTVAAIGYLPKGAGEELAVERLQGAFRGTTPVRAGGTSIAAPMPATNATARGRASRVAGTYHLALPGADILVRQKRGIPTTTLALHYLRAHDVAAEGGLVALAARSAVRGAGPYDASGLALAFERLGGTLGPSTSSDVMALGATVLSEHVAEAATLIGLVVREARFAEADVVAERAVLTEEAREAADDMFRFPFQLAFRGAFGDSGYGVPVGGTVESLASFTPRYAQVRWQSITAGRATIIAVSDEEPAAVAERLAAAMPDIVGPARMAIDPASLDGHWRGRGAPEIQARDKKQTAFAMLFPGPSRRDPAFHAAEVWAGVASGLGGRLFESLREKRSLAYTVIGTAWGRRRGGALGTYIATSPGREEEARAEMLKELKLFAEQAVTSDELRRATRYLAGQSEIGRMTAGAVAQEMAEAWFAGTGLEEMDAPWEVYGKVTAEDVRGVAAAGFDASCRAEGVVRGAV